MFGKVFAQMYDSSVCDNWQALVTFQQFIVLCDMQGVVDMTPQAISRRTGIPLTIIEKGIAELEKPDPRSRSPQAGGRRIERLDAHRTWGWQVVNYAYYRQLASMEEKREADRLRIARKREAEKPVTETLSHPVAGSRDLSHPVADVAHAEAEEEAKKDRKTVVGKADRFPDFWLAYPVKVKKKNALALWKRKGMDALADKVLADIKTRLEEDGQWREGFIPHPTTYLNQERWDDEIAPERRGRR